MPLNNSGPISIGGSTSGQSINLELGRSATAQSSLNESTLRTLANVASGQISLSSFYGKSNVVPGQQLYEAVGTYTFVVPAGVTSICACAIGGGGGGGYTNGTGGGGGALAYANNIAVNPGDNITVKVGTRGFGHSGNGDESYVLRSGTYHVRAGGGTGGGASPGTGGTVLNGTGGSGGNGGTGTSGNGAANFGGGGGGGAGGYSGNGGNAGNAGQTYAATTNGTAGSGGAGGGGAGASYFNFSGNVPTAYCNDGMIYYETEGIDRGGGGGGTGIKGSGTSGAGGVKGESFSIVSASNTYYSDQGEGRPGSDGFISTLDNFMTTPNGNTDGGRFGGGGGGGYSQYITYIPECPEEGYTSGYFVGSSGGGWGAVRIIWGSGRSYPSNAADV